MGYPSYTANGLESKSLLPKKESIVSAIHHEFSLVPDHLINTDSTMDMYDRGLRKLPVVVTIQGILLLSIIGGL
jgi:hypothetical protein